jgi:hypothetical protein
MGESCEASRFLEREEHVQGIFEVSGVALIHSPDSLM